MNDDLIAGEYALGLIRGNERRAIEARLAAEPLLRERVARWEARLAPFAADQPVTPPPELLEQVLARIDAGDAALPGTSTVRAAAAEWTELSPGVSCRVLRDDPVLKRRSMLIRMEPGATYMAHRHDDDEECLVISGDLAFGDLSLAAGDFHVAFKGMTHPPARSAGGCLLYITAGLG